MKRGNRVIILVHKGPPMLLLLLLLLLGPPMCSRCGTARWFFCGNGNFLLHTCFVGFYSGEVSRGRGGFVQTGSFLVHLGGVWNIGGGLGTIWFFCSKRGVFLVQSGRFFWCGPGITERMERRMYRQEGTDSGRGKENERGCFNS